MIQIDYELLKNKPYCSIADAMLLSGESRSTIMRRIQIGSLKAYKRPYSAKWIIKQDDLINYLESIGD